MTDFYKMEPFDPKKYIAENVLLTSEAMEISGVTRPRIASLIKTGKIVPIKKTGATSLFLREEIEAKRDELISLRK